MSNISKKKFFENYKYGIPQILTRQFIADTDTPISTLLKISKNEKYSFLLESVEGGDQRGRFSLLGCSPDLIWKVNKGKVEVESLDNSFDPNLLKINPNDSLKKLLNFSKIANDKLDAPYPVLVGYLGYPMIKYIEKIELKNHDTLEIPEAVMIRPKLVAVFDNIKDTINIMTAIYPKKKIDALAAYNQGKKIITNVITQLHSEINKNPLDNKKVFAIAPPIINVSKISIRLFNNFNYVEILDPPIIAVVGFVGLCNNSFKLFISLIKLWPAKEGRYLVIPTIEAWLR